jgi:hypothetical protein
VKTMRTSIGSSSGFSSGSGSERPDGFTAVDELLLALPEPQLASDRFAALHASLVHELEQCAAREPARRGAGRRLPLFGLRRLRTTRWRVAMSGAALGFLAVALALAHTVGGTPGSAGAPHPASTPHSAGASDPTGAPHTPYATATGLEEILAASWTATYTGVTGPVAAAAQASCVAYYNTDSHLVSPLQYTYDHISDSTIVLAGQQGQVIVIVLRAGPDLVSCFEVPTAPGSSSWTAYPVFVEPSVDRNDGRGLVPPSLGQWVLPGLPLNGQSGGIPLGPELSGSGQPAGGYAATIDYYVGVAAPNVSKVTAEIADPATGATQDVSEEVYAGTFFFWWPSQEGLLKQATAYASDGSVVGVYTMPVLPSFPAASR